MPPAPFFTATALSLCALSAAAVAQSQPTPGLPSQPFSAVAQAQNGGAGPQVTYQHGIEFVTVNGSANGAASAYPGIDGDAAPVAGRGGLGYDFRISRYEVGASSMAAFFAAADAIGTQAGQPIPFLTRPGNLSGSGQYGRVGNISWHTAAIYCNWLSNGQAMTRSAFMNGAYDVSTFGLSANQFTGQLTHNPGAQFWIPTLDEWIRAAHFDPNRNGPGQAGWWQFSISRDTYGNPGLPGQPAPFPFSGLGEVNGGFSTQNLAEFAVPLGAYSGIQSPWGLFDTVGQTTEWLEEPWYPFAGQLPVGRYQAGAYVTGSASDVAFGSIGHSFGQTTPFDAAYWMGFRIAASIPGPSTFPLVALAAAKSTRRSRRDLRSPR